MFISDTPGGEKSEIRGPAWSGAGESRLLGRRLLFPLSVLTWQKGATGAIWGPLYKDTNLNGLSKAPPPCPIIQRGEFQLVNREGGGIYISPLPCRWDRQNPGLKKKGARLPSWSSG